MLLLAAAAFAADSYVLLPRDAWFCPAAAEKDCLQIEQAAVPAETWRDPRAWKVVQDKGDWLQVESPAASPNLCLAPAPVAAGVQLQLWVKAASRVKVLDKTLVAPGPNGEQVTLAAGTAVGTSGEGYVIVSSDAASGRILVAQYSVGDTFTPVAPELPTGGTKVGLVGSNAVSLSDIGAVHLHEGGNYWSLDTGDHRTVWSADDTCAIVTGPVDTFAGSRTGPVTTPAVPVAGATAVPAGALSWPSGVAAGTATTAQNVTVDEKTKKKKGRTCWDALDGDGYFPVCAATP